MHYLSTMMKSLTLFAAALLLVGCGAERGMTIVIEEDAWRALGGDPPYTVGEVKARHGEPDRVVTNAYGADLVYSNAGLTFVCHDPSDLGGRLSRIIAYPPFRLRTADGIVLGESTPRDAEKIWGDIKWYGRGDFPGYWFFRRHSVRFLVPRDPALPAYPLNKEAHLDRPIERVILFVSNLKRMDFIPPTPVEIQADAAALKEPPESIAGYLKQVFIETLELDLDAVQDPDWNPLWDHFANRPFEKQFTSMSNENWYENRRRFEAELLARARDGACDAASLERIFDAVRPQPDDRTARIPVCAFRATMSGEPIWIIITKWERVDVDRAMSLGHILIQAFRVSDGELLDAVQCT